MDNEELMRAAIAAAAAGVALGQSPFGCAIAKEGQLIAACHNTVVSSLDISAHAEINAIRQACQTLQQIHLTDCIVATTCEPCPMCMAALHWARVEQVFFGATIADATAAGFNELSLSAQKVLELGGSQVRLSAGTLPTECRELFQRWEQQKNKTPY